MCFHPEQTDWTVASAFHEHRQRLRELVPETALRPLRTHICFSSGTVGSTLSPRIPQNSGLPCLMGLKPPPGARSWRRRSREGEGDDCRFSLPLNWAVGERERARLPVYPELSPTSYGRHTVGPGNQHGWLMIYNLQAEEFQAMNKHGSKAVGFLDQDVRCRHSQTVQSRGWLHRQRPLSSGFSPAEPSRSLHPRGHSTPRGALLPRQWSGAKFFFILCQKPASKWLLSSSILPSSPQPGAALATSAPFLLGQTQRGILHHSRLLLYTHPTAWALRTASPVLDEPPGEAGAVPTTVRSTCAFLPALDLQEHPSPHGLGRYLWREGPWRYPRKSGKY